MPKEKVNVITLGCSKNIVDSERLMRQIQLNDFVLVENPDRADTVIINTCGFIEPAKKESVDTILEAVGLKNKKRIKRIIVAGCLSQRYEIDLRKEIPEVDAFFGTENYKGIIEELNGNLKYDLLGERTLSSVHHTAYLKISEGCDNPCSFCAIPLMRGKHKSKPIEELIKETEYLAKNGTKEIVLIGQDTTDYGKDLYGKRNLSYLLQSLSKIEGIEWLRLMYAYPSHFPDDVIDEIANNTKLCKYIDIPLQHISDKILKSMRRGITKKRTMKLLNELRRRIPGLVLRTTLITGYPLEDKNDFEELCSFIKEYKFERLGVFTFSLEENTVDYILGDRISDTEKERRKNILMEVQQEISLELNRKLIGKEVKVLIDGKEGDYYISRSYAEAPEVDGEILIPVEKIKLKTGEFYKAIIYDANEYDLFAKVKKE